MKSFAYVAVVLWGVVSLVFFLFTVMPGDPARMMLDQREDSQVLESIRAKYGLDLPLSQQYLWYLNDLSPLAYHHKTEKHVSNLSTRSVLVHFYQNDRGAWVLKWPYLRTSFQLQDQPVHRIIAKVLPNTIVLALASMLIALLVGIFLGVVAAIKVGSWGDQLIAVLSTLGMSVPSFLSAIIIAYIFGFIFSNYTGLSMSGSLFVWDDFGEARHLALRNLILPAITLGIRPLAVITQLTRSSMLEVLDQDYMRTARAKGLNLRQQIWRHALPNALNPVITSASGWLASMLAGAVFVEYIFGWNGLGKLIVDALNTLDLPVIMGCVLVVAIFFTCINFAVDKIHQWMDPRIQ
jgi:peptide/nickel transport system permease protein